MSLQTCTICGGLHSTDLDLHWFPWRYKDFAMSVMGWSHKEKSYYRDALDLSWDQHGLDSVVGLPDRVRRKFRQCDDGRWRNPVLEQVRIEQVEKHLRRSAAGAKGGRPKSNALALDNQSLSIEKALAKQSESSQNQIHNQISSYEENIPFPRLKGNPPVKPASTLTYSSDFQSFWTIYPKKIAKGEAWKAWQKRQKPIPELEEILHVLRLAMNSLQWTKDAGQYIPLPSTWIKQRRWEDSVGPKPQTGSKDDDYNGEEI